MIGFYATLLLLLLGLFGAMLLVRVLLPALREEYRWAKRRADALEQVELEKEAGRSAARAELLEEEPQQRIGRQGNR